MDACRGAAGFRHRVLRGDVWLSAHDLLSGAVFGLDLAWTDGGNLWARIFGTPVAHIVAMVIGYALVFIGATLVADGWRRLHHASRAGTLMTDGIYARMRHPQYTGLLLIVFGEGVVHRPTIVSVLAFPVIILAYTLLARKVERQMLEKFGDAYHAYQEQVPMYIPRLDNGQPKEI